MLLCSYYGIGWLQKATTTMNKEQNEIENALINSYFSALEEAEKKEHKGQQQGAWAIAHFITHTDMTFDESVTAVKKGLKEKIVEAKRAGKSIQFTESVIQNSLALVPFACHAMATNDTIPASNRWPSMRYAKNILAVAGKSASDCLDTWPEVSSAVRKEAAAEIEVAYQSKGLPDKKATSKEVKDRIAGMANAKKERSSGSAAGLLDNKEKLVDKIKNLTVPQIRELVGFINADLDRRCYGTNFYEVSKEDVEAARKKD